MLVFLFIAFTVSLADRTFLQQHIATTHRLTNIETLARTERLLISGLAGSLGGDADDEVRYFLNFLLEDTGYPYMLPVADTLKYPLDRFKVVERYVYDWPILSELLQEIGSDLDITGTFKTSTQTLPDYNDLVETVRELNEIISVYDLTDDLNSLGSDNNIPMNSGNLLILTNISHTLQHFQQCVMWGRMADKDLVSSDEPFTIPGEEHWLDLYLGYLECLVQAGDDYQGKRNEVKNEILSHYGNVKRVKKTVQKILKIERIENDRYAEDCKRSANVSTVCRLERSRDPLNPFKTEQVIGTDIVYYHGIDVGRLATIQDCSQSGENKVFLYNPIGSFSINIVTEKLGTLSIQRGDGIIISVRDVRRICTPLVGYIEIYSITTASCS